MNRTSSSSTSSSSSEQETREDEILVEGNNSNASIESEPDSSSSSSSSEEGNHNDGMNGRINLLIMMDEDENNAFINVLNQEDYYSNGGPSPNTSTSPSNSSNRSTSGNSGNSRSSTEESRNSSAVARQHTYLPGTTNPLYPEQWLQPSSLSSSLSLSSPLPNAIYKKSNKSNNHNIGNHNGNGEFQSNVHGDDTTILPILQLGGIVLFPNSTIPLRLTHRSWVEYLSRQIACARDGGIRNIMSSQQIASVGDGVGANNDNDNSIQVRIGIITKLESGRRRRRRINFRPIQQQQQEQQSQQPQQESNVDSQNIRSNRMGRWNLGMLRRGITRRSSIRRSDNDDDNNNTNEEHEQSESGESGESSVHEHERYLHPLEPSSTSETKATDPLVDRIGTLATITYTHEEDSNIENGNENENQIIVTALSTGRFRVICSAIDQNDDNMRDDSACKMYHVQKLNEDFINVPSWISRHKKPHYDESECMDKGSSGSLNESKTDNDNDKINNEDFNKEEGDERQKAESSIYCNFHLNMIQDLSKVSPIPSFVYRKVWPWTLAEEIIREIDSNHVFDGLWKSLPPSSGRYMLDSSETDDTNNGYDNNDDDYVAHEQQSKKVKRGQRENQYGVDRSLCDPVSFSFWVAANLPLSEMNKLDILEMNVIERLRYLLENLINQRNVVKYIKCKRCGSKIAKMSELFTVAGAEGTSGAYVNEHGCIHQTITIKTVESQSMLYFGGEETKDSWFPGYSWTIACCHACSGHLGWKFKRVCRNLNERRSVFWGLSGSNVTTGKPSPRRIPSRISSNFYF